MGSVETAVIPVAGFGTRLLPVTQLVAKEYLPLGSKPAIQYIVEELAGAGIKRIVLVTSERKRTIEQLFNPDPALLAQLSNRSEILDRLWSPEDYPDLEISTVTQHEQLGLGHAIWCAREAVGDVPFAVALGDCPIGVGGRSGIMNRMVEQFDSCSADSKIVISFEEVPKEYVHRYGIAEPECIGEVFRINNLVEKPDPEDAPSNLAICGRYIFPGSIFDRLGNTSPDHVGEIQLTDAIKCMIGEGVLAFGVKLAAEDRRHDVGDFGSYVQSFVEFALADQELRKFVEQALEQEKKLKQ